MYILKTFNVFQIRNLELNSKISNFKIEFNKLRLISCFQIQHILIAVSLSTRESQTAKQ